MLDGSFLLSSTTTGWCPDQGHGIVPTKKFSQIIPLKKPNAAVLFQLMCSLRSTSFWAVMSEALPFTRHVMNAHVNGAATDQSW